MFVSSSRMRSIISTRIIIRIKLNFIQGLVFTIWFSLPCIFIEIVVKATFLRLADTVKSSFISDRHINDRVSNTEKACKGIANSDQWKLSVR